MRQLRAEIDKPVGCTSQRVDLSEFVVLACCSIQFELFLDGQGSDDLLSHVTCHQIIVLHMAIRYLHQNIKDNQKNDQIDTILKVGLFLILHESNDLSYDNRVCHVHQQVKENAGHGEKEPEFKHLYNSH